jgi:PAS domain S-box-containing protein
MIAPHATPGPDGRGSSLDRPHDGGRRPSPVRVLAQVAAAIFAVEVVVMGILALLPPLPSLTEALLDATLLTALSAPVLWRVVARPWQQLAASEHQRAEAFLDQTSEAVIGIDERGLITSFNRAAEQLFGYTTIEVLGRNVSMLAASPHRERHDDYLAAYHRTGERKIIGRLREVEGMRSDGTTLQLELAVTEIVMAGQRSYVGVLRDVSARRLVVTELERARNAAEAASQAKSQFLANMSHEIRTPMNGVIGMTALLLDTDLTSEQRLFAEAVRSSAESLLYVINDILDLSKIEAGKLELEAVDFDFRGTIEDVAGLLAERAHAKGIELLTVIPPEVPGTVGGDPSRFRQILMNLLGNAIKFTASGDVVVRAAVVERGGDDLTIRLEVADSGIGIPDEARGRLFQSFTQVDGSTTRRFGGTGLGLVITKQLVEMMGGEIDYLSVPGRGTTFFLTLRLGSRDAAKPAAEIWPALRGRRILCIDDNATNRAVLQQQLQAWGIDVVLADDGPAGLDRLAEAESASRPFDLVIVDMMMPGMDGVEVTRAARERPALALTPFLLLTSFAQRGQEAMARAAGINALMTKPVRQQQLLSSLAQLLGLGPVVSIRPADAAQRQGALATSYAAILLAEDNPINQMVASLQLERLGHRVTVANNGREAVTAFANGHFDLVLMDMQMPEMDGLEATAAIRAHEGSDRHTPIIAMTASAMSGDQERCLQAGMDDYLSKPVDPVALEATVQRWIMTPGTSSGGGVAGP